MATARVLFACTHNSARSQMAEAMLRELGGSAFEAFSAGTEATGIRPETVEVMSEIGYDLGGQRSKTMEEFRGHPCIGTSMTHPRSTATDGWMPFASLATSSAVASRRSSARPRAPGDSSPA